MVNKAKALSKKDGKAFLRAALIGVERSFRQELKSRGESITHDGSLGDAAEDAWIALLSNYLPTRYRVAKTFAVDHKGHTTDQLDCLIYDAHFTPALFGKDKHQYVPAEAVYATFEIKQHVNAAHLEMAAAKVRSIRKLSRTSAPIPWANGINPPKKPFPIIGGLLAIDADWADGLGAAFKKQLRRWSGDERLDFVLTAEDGYCDQTEATGSPKIVIGEGALIRGLFRLLVILRDKATVSAVEWEKYDAAFNSPPRKASRAKR
jgi:hypothetical protein